MNTTKPFMPAALEAEFLVRGDARVAGVTVHDDGGIKGVKEVRLQRGYSFPDALNDNMPRHAIVEATWRQALRRLNSDVVPCGCLDCLGSMSTFRIRRPTLIGNRHAAKPASKKLLDHLHIPAGIKEKQAWRKHAKAQGIGLSKWVRLTLNAEVAKEAAKWE